MLYDTSAEIHILRSLFKCAYRASTFELDALNQIRVLELRILSWLLGLNIALRLSVYSPYSAKKVVLSGLVLGHVDLGSLRDHHNLSILQLTYRSRL